MSILLPVTSDGLVKKCEELNNLVTNFKKSVDDQLVNVTKQIETEVSKVSKQYTEQCTQLTNLVASIKQDVDNTVTEVSKELKDWQEIKQKLSVTSRKGLVKLNVGGTKFQTNIDILTKEKDTLFTALFSQQFEPEKDDKGRIFIDRSAQLFSVILDYLRTGEFLYPEIVTDELRCQKFIAEAKFYKLQSLVDILTEPERKRKLKENGKKEESNGLKFSNGNLLDDKQQNKLNEFYGYPYQLWKLVYKAARDGFEATTFHRLCDNIGETITIIKSSNGYLFGGYASVSWQSCCNSYKSDPKAFIFTLTNPVGTAPVKYVNNCKCGNSAIGSNASYGPVFGSGSDICVSNLSNTNSSSYTNFPSVYKDTTTRGMNTFTGSRNFTTCDIEVYTLAP